jgi:hypothetical protein
MAQPEAPAHEYVPELQMVQSAAIAAAYLPAGQVSQVNWDCGKVSVYASTHTLPQGQILAPAAYDAQQALDFIDVAFITITHG